jgi:nitrite reductase/ring-hydroxylating ferredoxin subunit/uncharacterized membrane protein
MLIPFPFAFLSGAVLFDLGGVISGNVLFATTAMYLLIAGVATGVLAAVPGLVDYLLVVPPNSSGKRRATVHLLSNAIALTLFTLALLVRAESATAGLMALGFELAGLAALSVGGWLGGTLVYRNQIAVDHRYARAGKWRESTVSDEEQGRYAVGRETELETNQMKLLRINGRRIVLGRTPDGFVAFDDRCTHRGGSLADGVMICDIVQCPWHGSQFNTSTGAVQAGPAEHKIETYRVTERNGTLWLQLTS